MLIRQQYKSYLISTTSDFPVYFSGEKFDIPAKPVVNTILSSEMSASVYIINTSPFVVAGNFMEKHTKPAIHWCRLGV